MTRWHASKILLAVAVVLLGGCEPRPTESEFNALKQAEKSLNEWATDLVDTFETGNEFTSKPKTQDILDGAIIRSPLGKSIRSNMQEAMDAMISAITDLVLATKLKMEVKAIAGSANATFGSDQLVQSMQKNKMDEIAKLNSERDKAMQRFVDLENSRQQMFQQMRQELEE